MLVNVVCPGCLKRFRVSARFAGKKGPCPKCGTTMLIPVDVIEIRKEKNSPIQRQDLVFEPIQIKYSALGVLGILLLTFLFGCIPMYDTLRAVLGILGLCAVAFPLALFGYHVLRDRDELFSFSGEELYRRVGIVSAGYILLWLGFESFLAAIRAEVIISCLYFAAFAVLATLLVCPILEFKLPDAFLHYCTFAFAVIFLRFLLGLGWFWSSSGLVQHSAAPPPPLLPGM